MIRHEPANALAYAQRSIVHRLTRDQEKALADLDQALRPRLAVEHGVRRLLLLSGRGETEAQRAEEMLKASGVEAVTVPGDHHFDRDYKKLSNIILTSSAKP